MKNKETRHNKNGINRREALKTLGAVVSTGASAVLLDGCCATTPSPKTLNADPRPLPSGNSHQVQPAADAKELVQAAVETAKRLGATYADARVMVQQDESIRVEDNRVERLTHKQSTGIGVRVIVDGAWGFAAAQGEQFGDAAAIATSAVAVGKASASLRKGPPVTLAQEPSYQDSYMSPRQRDPFAVPMDEKVALLLAVNEKMRTAAPIGKTFSYLHFQKDLRTIATSDGSLIETDMLRTESGIGATAVANGDAQTRTYRPPPLAGGYECIEQAAFLEHAPRVAEEAVEKLKARRSPNGKFDIILLPSHLWLTIHESIGHATELDRVLGMEESLSGGSFATIDKLGTLKYGSAKVNARAICTRPDLLASVGYDDDGVKCQDWDIIRDGTLVGYSTNREVAGAINHSRSLGACRADAWSSIPILRMANICLMPGQERVALDDLIADTKNGILIDGDGSFSIDNKRLNFQFGGDGFWKIENGKRAHMLRDVTYSAITPAFWGSLDALCDEREWHPFGTFYCGKGDPGQSSQISHACVPARFRNIDIRRTE
ncbi:MAG: TldD/PmbA family protein [Myxococcota bacterium]|nr:TldD/PmbA family protein [Myxococcota bacterium]